MRWVRVLAAVALLSGLGATAAHAGTPADGVRCSADATWTFQSTGYGGRGTEGLAGSGSCSAADGRSWALDFSGTRMVSLNNTHCNYLGPEPIPTTTDFTTPDGAHITKVITWILNPVHYTYDIVPSLLGTPGPGTPAGIYTLSDGPGYGPQVGTAVTITDPTRPATCDETALYYTWPVKVVIQFDSAP